MMLTNSRWAEFPFSSIPKIDYGASIVYFLLRASLSVSNIPPLKYAVLILLKKVLERIKKVISKSF
jgi:hypothetical protein